MTAQGIDAIVSRLADVPVERGRTLVAIAGAPASGKSTLAAQLVAKLQERGGARAAALVPMDGFHLDNDQLDAMGQRHVKGAPQTFDAKGFAKLVRDIRAQTDPLGYPLFDRAQDKTIPGAGQLAPDIPVVVFEGNYLLLQDPNWSGLRGLFDLTVMLSAPIDVLRDRLVARWLTYGLTQDQAVARAESNDIPNAQLVIANSAPADLTLQSVLLAETQER